MTGCNNGLQDITFCPTTVDQALPATLGLLPEGPAWDAAHESGTVMNRFWRGITSLVAYTNARLCVYVDEFHCSSATESLDQWNAEYAFGIDCDPYGADLCTKVTAIGGQSCEFYTELALSLGWVISCEDLAEYEPIAGCFEIGCTPLGPTPVLQSGSNLGLGTLCRCSFGEVVHHPEPQFWQDTLTRRAECWVPGNNLGLGPDEDESCCMIVGYWNVIPEPPHGQSRGDLCTNSPDEIVFPCPVVTNKPVLALQPCDTTLRYKEWGHAHSWRIEVDLEASYALQALDKPVPDPNETASVAGIYEVGCTELCAPENPLASLLCFMEKIKPAHTRLFTEIV